MLASSRRGLVALVLVFAGCAHAGVRYAGEPAWGNATARYCAYCGGGETSMIVVERRVGDSRETLLVEVDSCIAGARWTTATVVRTRHAPDGSQERIADAFEVPVDVVACDREGPIHFRLRTTLAGESLRFDVRVETPTVSEGFE